MAGGSGSTATRDRGGPLMMLRRSRTPSALPTQRMLLVLLALLACGLPGEAWSAPQLAGEIEPAAFPASLLSGQFVSQTHIRLLYEGPGTVTGGMPGFLFDGAFHDPGLPVAPGDDPFGNAVTTPYAGPGLPAAGTTVYSVLLHFDPNLSGLPFSLTEGIALQATIAFDQPILGVYVTSDALNATDGVFGAVGVAYPTESARDMEFNYDGDTYAVSPDRSTLSFTAFGHNGGRFDQARILLAAEPTSVVPDVVGQTQAQAASSLQAVALLAAATLQASETVPPGEVLDQQPPGGTPVLPGETVDLVVSSGPDAPETVLEQGTVDVGGAPHTVALQRTYFDPVVVASVQVANNAAPVVARVGNVTTSSFDVRLQNPSGGPVAVDRVHYLVVETGVWTLDGFAFEAFTYTSTVTDAVGSFAAQPETYGRSYTQPVVLGQVMTENDPDWSVFWSRGATQGDPPSPAVLATGKMVGEDPDTTRADETIGVVVFEAGHGTLAGVEFEAGLGPDTVAGVDDAPPYAVAFGTAFAEAPEVAVVSMAGMNGANGGWAQAHGPAPATPTSLALSIDEDQIADPERSHITEQVAYAVFRTATRGAPVPGLPVAGLAVLGAALAALGARLARPGG